MDMQTTPRLYGVEIGYERGIDYGINQSHLDVDEGDKTNYTRQSSTSSAESDVEMRVLKLKGDDDDFDDGSEGLQMHIQDVTLSALADESNEAICGEYSTFYDTFQLIGNGTFGSVKLAARKDTGLLASLILPYSYAHKNMFRLSQSLFAKTRCCLKVGFVLSIAQIAWFQLKCICWRPSNTKTSSRCWMCLRIRSTISW